MTTKEFVTLERRLLPSLPGFAVKNRLMLVTPIEHTLKGLNFEGSSFDKSSFYVTWFYLPLSVPRRHLILSLGTRLRLRNGVDGWTSAAPDVVPALLDAIRGDAMPMLATLQTPRDVAGAALAEFRATKAAIGLESAAYLLARDGDTINALALLDELLAFMPRTGAACLDIVSRAEQLQRLLRDDAAAAKAQLLAWEAESVRNLRLEEFASTSTIR